jgi:hypothetical protein
MRSFMPATGMGFLGVILSHNGRTTFSLLRLQHALDCNHLRLLVLWREASAVSSTVRRFCCRSPPRSCANIKDVIRMSKVAGQALGVSRHDMLI